LKEFVLSYLGFVLTDQLLQLLLFGSQLIDHVPKIGVGFVELLKLIIHLLSFVFKGRDLVLHRRDFFFQLLYFEVEHKLKLF